MQRDLCPSQPGRHPAARGRHQMRLSERAPRALTGSSGASRNDGSGSLEIEWGACGGLFTLSSCRPAPRAGSRSKEQPRRLLTHSAFRSTESAKGETMLLLIILILLIFGFGYGGYRMGPGWGYYGGGGVSLILTIVLLLLLLRVI